ncbi:putative exopolyphosphatase [Erysiphe necator]|nr:putative exopolyphosphatase [Erysiphe necator]
MSLSRVPVATFLSTAKNVLKRYTTDLPHASTKYTFVIGNESADLDSICSAIVFAYISTYFPKISNKLTTETPSALYIPLANLQTDSLHLRPELTTALQHAHLMPSEILTLSDLPKSLPPPEQTRWVLVDHNRLRGELGKFYGKRIVGCIDHHEDEGLFVGDEKSDGLLEREPRLIEQVCSCASLVTAWARERWFPREHQVTAESSTQLRVNRDEAVNWGQEDARLAYLALAPILLDSVCLQSARTKQEDFAAVMFLENLITQHYGATYDRSTYYKKISIAKQDLDSFTLTNIFQKDYKQWAESSLTQDSSLLPFNFGIIAVVKPIAFLLKKANGVLIFLQTLQSFARERNLSLVALMTSFSLDDKFHRELLVWGLDKKGVKASKLFELTAGPELILRKWCQGDLILDWDCNGRQDEKVVDKNPCIDWRRCWTQHETNSSRKQVYPLLRSAIRSTFVSSQSL